MLERFFGLAENGTDIRRELLAGLTTFLTMAYIVVVNPSILSDTGMDWGAVFVATCLAAALGSLIMGLYANYPFGLADGMGLGFITYVLGKALAGRIRDIHIAVWLIAALFAVRFALL